MTITKLLSYVIEYIDEHTEPGFITEVTAYTTRHDVLLLLLATRAVDRLFVVSRQFAPALVAREPDLVLGDMLVELQEAVKAATK